MTVVTSRHIARAGGSILFCADATQRLSTECHCDVGILIAVRECCGGDTAFDEGVVGSARASKEGMAGIFCPL
jgi:hypothetical protein